MNHAKWHTSVAVLLLMAGTSFAQQATSRPAAAPPPATAPAGDPVEMVRQSRMALRSADLAALKDCAEPHLRDISQVIQEAKVLVKQDLSSSASPQAASPATRPAAPPVKVAAAAAPARPTTQRANAEALEEMRRTKFANPMAMADSFYQAGKLPEATVLYEQALQSGLYPSDKDWLLFQSAVCQEKDNPSASVERYERLQSECPQSLWAPMAKARLGVVQWLLSDEVRQVLGDGGPAPKGH